MRNLRSRDEMDLGSSRPLIYRGFAGADRRPSSFPWKGDDFQIMILQMKRGTVRLDYRAGWTALVFWNAEVYFADEILTFDAMIDLIASRFEFGAFNFPVRRDYPNDVEMASGDHR